MPTPTPSLIASAPALDLRDEVASLSAQLDAMTRERDQLHVIVDLQQEIGSSLQVTEILQRTARRLGELFALDRSSIYLAGERDAEVRLVATYEDPTLHDFVVDLARYPELAQAFSSGETVVIPDVRQDTRLAGVREHLALRGVRSIIVAPLRWRTSVIGAIELRSERPGTAFTPRDISFCEIIASLVSRALRNAHRFEQAQRADDAETQRRRRLELERIAFVAFLRRMVDRYARGDGQRWAETLLPRESDDELDRLVSVAMQVIAEEAKGDQTGAPARHR